MRHLMRAGRQRDFDREARVTRLATYNAERARGLVHTEEWRAFMVEEQAWWDGERLALSLDLPPDRLGGSS